jgi:MFS family permease
VSEPPIVSEQADQEQPVLRRYLSALAYRDYRILWVANLSSQAAAWALIVARGWLVYTMSGSSGWVGLVTFAAMIPRVVVTPISGYLSDRFDRRTVLASMFALNLLQNVVLATLTIAGTIQIWHLVVLSFINGAARAAQMPAGQALLVNLVPRRLLLNAVALNQATLQGARLVGPAAIVPFLAWTGPQGAFAFCVGFYALSFVLVRYIHTPSTGQIDHGQGLFHNMAAGAVYIYQNLTLRAIVLLTLFHCGLTMSFESLLPVLSKQQFGSEGVGVSILMMGIGTGALITSIFLAGVRREASRGWLFWYCGLLSGITPCLLALATTMPIALSIGHDRGLFLGASLAMIGVFGMGASQSGYMTLTHTMIQTIAPDWVRGRIGGIYSIHIGGTMALVNLFNGALADSFGAPLLLIVGGMSFVVMMLISWQYLTLRHIYTRGLNHTTQDWSTQSA